MSSATTVDVIAKFTRGVADSIAKDVRTPNLTQEEL